MAKSLLLRPVRKHHRRAAQSDPGRGAPAVDGAELAIEPRPGDVAPRGDVSGDILDWGDASERRSEERRGGIAPLA